jgi:eukaryotic-like serine/threonine-protein kinase
LPQPGTLIEGKYEILGKIREGGMGAIYKVRHRLLDEVRVIKVMRPQILSNEEMKRRFVEEARTATKLKHPNICTIYDFALDEDGTAYLVMEFIDGVTLADLFRTPDPPGLPVTLEVAHQALLALGYLHRRNVVHRDIAPDNLMLTSDEEGRPLIKLIDLGIAKALDSKSGDMTSTGVFLGKLKYASPEQYGALAAGEKIDGRSDLYCLGVVIYELLTGVRPFTGDTPAEMLRSHLFQPPLPFSQTDPTGKVPPDLRAAIMKALEKKRDDRFASAEEFDREIQRLRTQVASADDPDATIALVSTVRRSREIVPGVITPSAQDRIDVRFKAAATPHPSKSGVTTPPASDLEKTARSPDQDSVPTAPLPAPPRRRLSPLAIGLLVAIGPAAALIYLRSSRTPRNVEAATPGVASRNALPPTEKPAEARPTTAPAGPAERAAAVPPPSAATAPPEAVSPARAEATPVPPAVPAAAPPAAAALRPTAAPRRPTATARPKPTAPLFVAQKDVRARPAFAPTPESPAVPAVSSPAQAVRTAPPPPPPTSPPRAAPTAASAPEAAPAPASEQDRIRDVIKRYERAQNTLDADLYARVYPGANRARVQSAFENFSSQSVTLDQIRIEIQPGGTRAVAHVHEKRVAVPRVGSEQRLEGERTIVLQKQGDGWVIASLQ